MIKIYMKTIIYSIKNSDKDGHILWVNNVWDNYIRESGLVVVDLIKILFNFSFFYLYYKSKEMTMMMWIVDDLMFFLLLVVVFWSVFLILYIKKEKNMKQKTLS